MIGLIPIGLPVGSTVAPFEPFWVNGDYKDTNMCPICEYGGQPMVQIWTKGDKTPELSILAKLVDRQTAQTPEGVRSFLIDANFGADDGASKSRLGLWSTRWGTKNLVYMCRRAALSETLDNYRLDEKGWSNVVYTIKDRKVTATFTDPRGAELDELSAAIKALK